MDFQCRDWMGNCHTVKVMGEVILADANSHIYLAKLSRSTYRVHYGLQHNFFGSLEDAVVEFGNCFLHANQTED